MKAGETVSHYRILEKLGEGGMGVVYRALDQHLDRTVALKLLPAEAAFSAERKQRFIREAKAASALNHPHIVTIYDVGQDLSGGVERDYIAMEHVEGGSLDGLLKTKPLGTGEALGIALQIADALSAAHEAGIVHRDVKPANILLTKKGDVKLADFGLAKLTEPQPGENDPTRTAGLQTEAGAVLGTAAYMSPEQAEGKPVDFRSDIFSFGSVLYEMLTGHRPFAGDSNVSTRMAILGQTPPPPRSLKGDVPPELERVVLRCLEKQREARHATGAELLKDLQRVRALVEREQARRALIWRRPAVAIPAALLILAGLSVGAWLAVKTSRVRWARSVAIPEITRLVEQGKTVAAYHRARRTREILSDDAELERLWKGLTSVVSIRTEPSGAEVYWKDYADSAASWERAGRTPLERVTFPWGYLRLRIEKDGFESQERSATAFGLANSTSVLRPVGSSPAGMVWVPGGSRDISGKSVDYAGFWLDKFEVTNREFKKFVDAGGYRNSEHWKEPFLRDGREVSWEDGTRELLDKTGRPGPSTWALGTYADGEEEYPVRGVSWYEAAAFAEFAGKSLPTYYHWLRATDPFTPPSVLELSNFGGRGPAPVGRHQGLGPFGTYDMAGNVKEWCWNRSADKRYTLGGAWNDAVYLYRQGHAQPPFDRSEIYGFRCARYEGEVAEALRDPIERTWRDYAREKPVDDAAFRLIESIYAYDRTELKPETQTLESGSAHWRLEKASFQAAYGNERVIVYLYLPKSAAPPYQTVLYFPGSGAEAVASHDWDLTNLLDFVIKSGRAVVVPVYNGLYERRFPKPVPGGRQSRARRDLTIQWTKDLARSVDYLETRKDIDSRKLAFYGISLGARMGVIFTAFEKRLKASILLAGGLDAGDAPPEVDEINFLTRIKVPTLMLNGRDDFRFPLEVSQKPMFQLLGPPEGDKRHGLISGGHLPTKIETIREVLDWLDRYLGPVAAPGS